MMKCLYNEAQTHSQALFEIGIVSEFGLHYTNKRLDKCKIKQCRNQWCEIDPDWSLILNGMIHLHLPVSCTLCFYLIKETDSNI